jgi:hypothetical protein
MEHCREFSRQLGGEEPLRFVGISSGTHRAEGVEFAAARGEGIHQEHDAISPRQIAPQRADQHRVHLRFTGMAYAQDARERENHNEAGEHLKDAIDGIEHPLDSDFWKHQSITALFDLRSIKKWASLKTGHKLNP